MNSRITVVVTYIAQARNVTTMATRPMATFITVGRAWMIARGSG